MESTIEDPNNSTGPAVCRICMCGETSIPYLGKQAGEPLISVCRCSGTMGLYHRSCLEHWLTLTKTKSCEICKYPFKTSQKERGVIDYFRLRGYEKRHNEVNRNPFVDLTFILIVSPLAIIALYLCVHGATLAGHKYHIAFENRKIDDARNLEIRNETSMEFALFVFVAVVLFFVYTGFVLVMSISHYTQFRMWQHKNMLLFVIDDMDMDQLIQYTRQYRPRNNLRLKISQSWNKFRGNRSTQVETARVEVIPIEPIVLPDLLSTFILNEAVTNKTPEQQTKRTVATSTPQMYTEKPGVLDISPISCNDLFAQGPSGSSMAVNVVGLPKTQSVYSICSPKNRMPLDSCSPVSSFKPTSPPQSTETILGRFHVEHVPN